MRKRIVKLIYQTYLPYQGRYPRVSGQAKILKDAGYDISVLGCDREGRHPETEEIDGIKVERIKVKTSEMKGPLRQLFPLVIFYFKAFLWLSRKKIDMIHCHNLDILPLGYIMKKVKNCKVIFDAHEPDYYALWPDKWNFFVRLVDRLDIFFAGRVDAVTVTNNYQVRKYKKAGLKRVDLIGNYPPPAMRIDSGSERKSLNSAVTFGRFGTFYPAVGLEETIKAFRKVFNDYPEARLLLGGRVVDNYKESFSRQIESIKSRVDYIGPYDAREMKDLYKKIDVSCLIYPGSKWFRNITPRKFFDSLANGLPVIITDIGGLGDVVRKHKCGMVVDEKDINSIYSAMEMLIKDKSVIEEMSHNALELANSEYSWLGLTEKYTGVVHEMLR